MDYILLMLAAVLLILVVFIVIREPSSAHADQPPSDKGITPLEPAADQPVPTKLSINSSEAASKGRVE